MTFESKCAHRCAIVGFPLAEDKKEGPSHKLPFFGLKLDCQLTNYVISGDWHLRKAETETVGIPGRIFLRRTIWQSQLHHWVHLNQEFRSDLLWWKLQSSEMAPQCSESRTTERDILNRRIRNWLMALWPPS